MLIHEARTTSLKTHGLYRVPIPEKLKIGVSQRARTVGHTETREKEQTVSQALLEVPNAWGDKPSGVV